MVIYRGLTKLSTAFSKLLHFELFGMYPVGKVVKKGLKIERYRLEMPAYGMNFKRRAFYERLGITLGGRWVRGWRRRVDFYNIDEKVYLASSENKLALA